MFSTSTRGIILSLLLVFSIVTVFSYSEIYAQKQAEVKSVSFEETTIIEFENKGSTDIETIRMWLGSGFTFKSFKTEKGWIGEKNPQGVIILTTAEPVKPGESVKFGVKTDKPKPGINWKIIDVNDEQIQVGKTLAEDLSEPIIEKESPEPAQSTIGVLSDSTFRLIPDKPKVGSSVRVTGDNFGSNQKLDLYLDNTKLETIETDVNGHFMVSSKIPESQKAERVDFIIKDSNKNQKTISLRLGEGEDRVPPTEKIPLTMRGFPDVLYRGDELKITGTAMPGSTVTATIKNPNGEITTTNATEVDSKGNWSYEGFVPADASFGKYSAVISDGSKDLLKNWNVESAKTIQIQPVKLVYDPGETIVFNGTALANAELEIILEDPQNNEVFEDILSIGALGEVKFEFPTDQATPEGTYVLIAKQGIETEIIFVGVGQLPKDPLSAIMDKTNYKSGETVIVNIDGVPNSSVNLLVLDPADKEKFSDSSIILGPDGKKEYKIDLKDYAAGTYTLAVNRANSKTFETFSVGLLLGSGPITISTTKINYEPGDPILILGDSNSNIIVTVSLINPDENIVKTKETFTDKNGKLFEESFRIPSDAKPGIWKIRAESGANFEVIEIEVTGTMEEGMIIQVIGIDNFPGIGKVVNFEIISAAQTVMIEIIAEDGSVLDELIFPASEAGEIKQPWPIPKELPPGTYKITAKDAFSNAETTFEYSG